MDGFWAGVTLVILTIVAYTAVWRVEDVVLRRIADSDLLRVRIVGTGLSALGLLAGWPLPNTNASADLALQASAVLSMTALVVVGQVLAVGAFLLGRSLTQQYLGTRRGHKT